jgi:hypothetical protein
MMAMGKSGEKKTKSAVKLRAGGMVKKMAKGGGVKAPKKSPRPSPRPDDLQEGMAIRSGNRQSELEASEYNEPLRGRRGMRMGGMVKK